jgi:ribosomal protein S18 acetylase RimI-like enzyme
MTTMTAIDTKNLPLLESGTLPGGAPFDAVLLAPFHAAACAALHGTTIGGLAGDEKAYMLGKSSAYFSAHLRRPAGNAVIGVVSRARLVAQAMVLHPTSALPATGMVDMPPVAPPGKVSVMQAVSVHPRFRGHGLMDMMIRHWIDHAAAHGRTDLLAEIHVANAASWANFLRAGLNLVGIGRDPSDGVLVYNAHEKTALARAKSLTPEFNRYAGLPRATCAPGDLETQRALMAAGYAVTGRDAAKQNLVLTRLHP